MGVQETEPYPCKSSRNGKHPTKLWSLDRVNYCSARMEGTMCHYRGSYIADERAKAEADRQRELEAKRTQAVDKLKQEADTAAHKAASTPAKEPVPAK